MGWWDGATRRLTGGWGLYFSRWVSLAAGVYLMVLSGSVYMFAVYSGDLKQRFGYSTEEVNLIGTLGNAGTWGGFVGGLWLDFFGPRSTCLIGGVMAFTGYFLVYLAASTHFVTNNVVVGIFAAVMGQGSSWVYGAALKINTMNFRSEDRGKVVGALVCFFGLSSGVLTQLYKGFYSPNVLDFLLFCAILIGSGSIFIGMLINVFPTPFSYEDETKMKRIPFIYLIGVLLAIFNGVSSIVTGTTDVSALPFAATMLALLVPFLFVPINTGPLFVFRRTQQPSVVDSESIGLNGSIDSSVNSTLPDGDQHEKTQSSDLEDLSLWQSLKRLDFWLLFVTFFAVIGSGITIVNNFSELVYSITSVDHSVVYPTADVPDYKTINTLVSLFSSFNTIGRMLVGFLSDRVAARWGTAARVTLLTATSALMALVQIYMAFAVYVPMLYPGVIFLGIAYGATFCIAPTLTLEFFGFSYFASNFGLIGLAPAIASELLATLLAGKLNDYFRKDGEFYTVDSSGNKTSHCNNSSCYRYTFFITAFFSSLAILISLWLWRRRAKAEAAKKLSPYTTLAADTPRYHAKDDEEEESKTESRW